MIQWWIYRNRLQNYLHLKNNLPVKITIEVFGFTQDENRHIGFEIGGQRKLRIVHGESLLASRVDKTFENIVQNVERIKLEESGADHE